MNFFAYAKKGQQPQRVSALPTGLSCCASSLRLSPSGFHP
jgi:hypothetical protein